MFEEALYVLDGEGETTVWQPDSEKRTFVWRKGSMFSPPLNVWRQHRNRGQKPARLVSFHDMPVVMDIFHSPQFLFNNPFIFHERYNNEPGYFTFDKSKLRSGGTAAMFSEGERG